MHVKRESDMTSLAPSSPPRSPRRPFYFVASPTPDGADRMSLGGSTPGRSPLHRYVRYGSSPIHHSRESSTTRGSWRKIPPVRGVGGGEEEEEVEELEEEEERRLGAKCYAVMFVVGFVVLFSIFSLILWGASRAYKPEIAVKRLVFKRYVIQAGMDLTGVPTKMMTIDSTVQIKFRNTATFFGVHVTATPLELYYYDLKIASGNMMEFWQKRKSERVLTTAVKAKQVPLYGAGTTLSSREEGGTGVAPFNLTFTIRANGNVLGKLVHSKFYRHIRCGVVLHEDRLGGPVSLGSCHYWE